MSCVEVRKIRTHSHAVAPGQQSQTEPLRAWFIIVPSAEITRGGERGADQHAIVRFAVQRCEVVLAVFVRDPLDVIAPPRRP